MVKDNSNINGVTEIQKVIVGENRVSTQRKVVKFNEDYTIEWVKGANGATKFNDVNEAEYAIRRSFGEDDFGLSLYKVTPVSYYKDKVNWTYVQQLPLKRLDSYIRLEDLTDEVIDHSTGENELRILEMNDMEIYKNQKEIKDKTFEFIGKLIDLHNKTDKKYCISGALSVEKEVKHCQGCKICDRIDAYAKLLDEPSTSKFYKYILGEEKGRFVSMKGKMSKEVYNEDELEHISYLLRDFVALRKNEFSIKQIAEFYGIGISTMYRMYDVIADSEFHFTIGRMKRTSRTDRDYNRRSIDPWF